MRFIHTTKGTGHLVNLDHIIRVEPASDEKGVLLGFYIDENGEPKSDRFHFEPFIRAMNQGPRLV